MQAGKRKRAVTHKKTSESRCSGLDTPERVWACGAEARANGIAGQTTRLEEARAGLWEALKVSGVEGQAGIFARLEDLQEALEALRRELRSPSDALGKAGEQGRDAEGIREVRIREAESERNKAAAAIRNCQETLKRVDRVFAFLGGMIEDRVGQANGGAYRFAQPGSGRRQPANREGAGHWEG